MILETVGSVASILGLSLSAYDKFIAKNGNSPLSQYMGLFVEISPYTEAWKNIHKEYHVLMGDINNLYSLVTHYEGRNELEKSADNIRTADIRAAIRGGTLTLAVTDFKARLEIDFSIIAGATGIKSPDALEELKVKAPSLFRLLKSVMQSSEATTRAHLTFCNFLETIRPNVEDDRIDPECVKFIISQRRVLSSIFSSVIKETDQAIIAMLNMYIIITNEVKP